MIGRTVLGRYDIQKLLGEGGMGRVYLARQNDLGRQVVVKVMHDHIAADNKFRERFQREMQLMARFQHPYAVTLYDASLNDTGMPFIVMEYIKGTNLEGLLAKVKKMTPPRVGKIVTQLCDVLQAAHEEGVIHRDLKPANLMVVDPDSPKERIKVMDFGLAKMIHTSEARKVTDTTVDFAVGTPAYICPEQVRGESMDHRGDLYSVGVMTYELLTGRVPFVGTSGMDVLLAHATEDPPRFADIGAGGWVPAGVEEVVRWALAKDPSDRPQSAREFADAFAKALKVAKAASDSAMRLQGIGYDDDDDLSPEESVLMLEPFAHASTGRQSSGGDGTEVVAAEAATSTTPLPAANDLSVLRYHLDAWMPEAIALMKLKGFVQDNGGSVLESNPGRVRVRFSGGGGMAAWFGIGRGQHTAIELDLHLVRPDLTKPNSLTIHAIFKPSHATLLGDKTWRDRCGNIFVDLRAYLMGGFSG